MENKQREIRLRIYHKLLAGFGLMGLIMAFIFFLGNQTARNSSAFIEGMFTHKIRPLARITNLQAHANMIRLLEAEISIPDDTWGSAGRAGELMKSSEKFEKELKDFTTQFLQKRSEEGVYLIQSWQNYRKQLKRTLKYALAVKMAEARNVAMYASLPAFREFSRELEKIAIGNEKIAQQEYTQALRQMETRQKAFIAISIGGIVFGIISAIFFAYSISSRIRSLSEGSIHLAEGDLDHLVKIKGHDEIADLASSFNEMSIQIKKRQEALEENERFLQSVFDSIQDGISVLDRELNVMRVNQWMENMYSDQMPLTGKKCYKLYQKIDTICPWCPSVKAIETGETHNAIVPYPSEENPEGWIDLSSFPLRNAQGRVVGVIEHVKDISERMGAEEALKHSEAQFRTLMEQSPISIQIMTPDGCIIQVNRAWEKLWGATMGEIRNYNILQDEQFKKLGIMQYIEKGFSGEATLIPPAEYDAREQVKTGNKRWVQARIYPVRDERGSIRNVILMHEDITEQKWAQEELAKYHKHLEEMVEERTRELMEAQKAMVNLVEDLNLSKEEVEQKAAELEAFTYSVSHDLKAPLRAIDGYSKILAEEYADKLDEEGLRFLNTVRQEASQMNALIDDLLEYSRIERRKIALKEVDVSLLIKDIVMTRAEILKKEGFDTKVDLPITRVVAESEGLFHALSNVVDNAIKFAGGREKPEIIIDGFETAADRIIRVADNGIGFDMKYHDRIFEIFHRLERTEDYPGTGVGLAIVKKMMERMGGRVWAEAEPGKGATFYLAIPKK